MTLIFSFYFIISKDERETSIFETRKETKKESSPLSYLLRLYSEWVLTQIILYTNVPFLLIFTIFFKFFIVSHGKNMRNWIGMKFEKRKITCLELSTSDLLWPFLDCEVEIFSWVDLSCFSPECSCCFLAYFLAHNPFITSAYATHKDYKLISNFKESKVVLQHLINHKRKERTNLE